MRAHQYRELAEKLRADGLGTGQIIERWVRERGLNPREAARLSHGHTQQQAADEWNRFFPDADHPCTRKHISNWETSRQPSLDTLNKLARVYRCSAGELLGGEDYSHLDPRRPAVPGATVLAVAVAVVTHGGQILLVHARGGSWQFPSGVVKPDQDAAQRAVEETAAETGAHCRVTRHLGGRVHPISGAWCDYFAAEYLAGDIANGQPGENSTVTWAPISKLTDFVPRDRVFPPVLDALGARMTDQPTIATAIVTSDRGVLLAQRRDGKPPWTFIAGAVEDGESVEDAAVREVKEETGLAAVVSHLIGERVHPKTGRLMKYLACVPVNGLDVHVGDPDDLTAVGWFGFEDALELLPGVFEPVEEYLRRTL